VKLRDLSIGKKIFIGIGASFLITMIIMGFLMNNQFDGLRNRTVESVRDFFLSMEESRIEDVTETTAQVFSDLYQNNRDELSEAELKELIDDYNKNIEFGEIGYFFIYDYNGDTISLPPTPEIVGENRWDIQDPEGTYILRELSEAAQNGGGFVEYIYANPETGEDETKTSYVTPIAGTDYFIGAGTYDEQIVANLAVIRDNMGSIIDGIFFMVIAFLVVGTLVVGAIIWFISRYISNNIKEILTGMNKMADGDLTYQMEVKSKDEIGQLAKAYNQTVDSLQEMVGKIKGNMADLNSQSEELSATGQEVERTAEEVGRAIENVASGAEEQSAQMDESKGIISDLSAEIKKTRDMSENMKASSTEVKENVNTGNQAMNNSIEQVNQVKGYSEEISQQINSLGELSGQIGEIVELINGISQQTNLLALNAAIEAARAGEAGRGFSVVADEIRELAEESSEATENISKLIKEIQTNVNDSIKKMDQTEKAVDNTVEVISDTDRTFDNIEQAVDDLSELIDGITSQSNHMDSLSNNVQAMVSDIAAVSDEAASNAEEVAASSEEQIASTEEIVASAERLAEMSDDLQILIDKFAV